MESERLKNGERKESWKRVRKERGRVEERDEGGEAMEFILISPAGRETQKEEEKTRVAQRSAFWFLWQLQAIILNRYLL